MSANFNFWKMAFNYKWVDTISLRDAVKTNNTPFGEITPEEYKIITNTDFTVQ